VALTIADRKAIELVFMRGPSGLLEEGWTTDEIAEFLQKDEVRQCLEAMLVACSGQETASARVRYGLRRGMTRLAPEALDVFRKALAGPKYLRNKQGKIMIGLHGPLVEEPQPTSNQLRAALELLDRLGLPPESRDVHRERAPHTLNVNVITGAQDKKTIAEVLSDEGTHEERVLSRERVRGVIDALTKKLPNLRAKLLPLSAPKKGNGKKPKPSAGKKPSVKKVKVKAKPA